MATQSLAGALWLLARLSTSATAFFLVDPLGLAIFIGAAVVAIVLGLGMLVRPSTSREAFAAFLPGQRPTLSGWRLTTIP
jgi:hypothetical protein